MRMFNQLGFIGVCVLLTGAAAPEKHLPKKHQTKNFVIYYSEETEPYAKDFVGNIEKFREKVLNDLGTHIPTGTKLVLATDLSQMRRLAPGRVQVPPWAIGLAFSGHNLILLRTQTQNERALPKDLHKVFIHEWAHVAFDHAVSFRAVPRWFQEGFAIYQSEEQSLSRYQALASGVLSGRLFSLETLSDSFPSSIHEAELAYAQSIDFVSFLLKEFGPSSFHNFIQLLRADHPFMLALEEAYNDSILTLEEDWHRDLKKRFSWIPLLTGTAVVWFLASLIFILAYIKKRRRLLQQFEELDDPEEPSLGSQKGST